MSVVSVSEIVAYEGQEVTIRGWLYNRRSSGKVHFLQVRDGTGIVQCVVAKGETPDPLCDLSDHITQESSLIVSGIVRKDLRSYGGVEIVVRDLSVVQMAEEYPITPKEHGVGFLMENRHLWLRSTRQHAILRIRSELVTAIRDYFNERGFVLIDAPLLTPSSCEGTTTLFETDYFGQRAYLTQSGQLYMEAAAMAFGKVYCFGPTFRAEKSKTRRHLTEFWMVEPEVAYHGLEENVELAEDFIVSMCRRVVERKERELRILERDITPLLMVEKPFPRLTYTEALEILRRKGSTLPWGEDFGGDEETLLSEGWDRPIIIHRYPAQCKAFYMKRDPMDERLSLSMDVLAPDGYGEIIGGGQREDDYQRLRDRITVHNLSTETLQWYLDLRRFGSVPHAGFGLGLERTLAWICGLHHVRETIPFPRMLERLTP